MNIPVFKECTCCKRSIIAGSFLWSDEDKRICVCCECLGTDKDINLCRRVKCPKYKYIDRDFIMDVEQPVDENEVEKPVAEYDESLHKCYRCGKDLLAFLYINCKVAQFNIKGDIDAKTDNKIKIKLCPACSKELLKFLPLQLIKEEPLDK
jgi:hypothetical protein